jgi:hypothetical protein
VNRGHGRDASGQIILGFGPEGIDEEAELKSSAKMKTIRLAFAKGS